MEKILFVRPAHDDVTSYLFYYSKQLLKEAELKGFKVLNKEKEKANFKVITEIIETINPRFIMFNGHGNSRTICGHKDEALIVLDKNHRLLEKKMIYSLSCSSAAELGKGVANEETTFIGYVDEFALGMDGQSQTTIQRDERAKLFLEPSNSLVQSLLKGNSAHEAVKKAKELMKQNISKLRTDPFPDAKDYLPYLFNNYAVLEVLGNKEAKI